MTIEMDYYSDVLCIWAWIAERRLDELKTQFGDEIAINSRFVNVFGNTASQIGEKWAARGGYEGFGKHVTEAAAPFPHAPVADSIWRSVRPKSSAPAHAVLKAVEISHSAEDAGKLAFTVRERFFTATMDIGDLEVLLQLADSEGLDRRLIDAALTSGAAIAEVMKDYQAALAQGIKGSPSWVLDGGRQILYGNVGYRVISANAAELLSQPSGEASWC